MSHQLCAGASRGSRAGSPRRPSAVWRWWPRSSPSWSPRPRPGLVARLPRQLVHGDFRDDNVGFRHGRPVLLVDFMGERAALPLAMARQPLSSIGGWAARLDDQAVARHHAASVGPDLAVAGQLMAELGRWQDTFA
jgi:hypothetical protein